MKRLSSNLHVASLDGTEMIFCRCGAALGAADPKQDAKSLLRKRDVDLSAAGPKINPHALGSRRFFLREYLCPVCCRLIETEVALKES